MIAAGIKLWKIDQASTDYYDIKQTIIQEKAKFLLQKVPFPVFRYLVFVSEDGIMKERAVNSLFEKVIRSRSK